MEVAKQTFPKEVLSCGEGATSLFGSRASQADASGGPCGHGLCYPSQENVDSGKGKQRKTSFIFSFHGCLVLKDLETCSFALLDSVKLRCSTELKYNRCITEVTGICVHISLLDYYFKVVLKGTSLEVSQNQITTLQSQWSFMVFCWKFGNSFSVYDLPMEVTTYHSLFWNLWDEEGCFLFGFVSGRYLQALLCNREKLV